MLFAILLALLPAVAGLPSTAKVIETRAVPSAAHPNRVVVLWMDAQTVSPCWEDADEPYAPSCPAATRGCSFAGPTRISLLDTSTQRVINTLTVPDPLTGKDTFEIPYVIERGGPYFVTGRKNYGKPEVLRFRDFNGDGLPYEFALYDAESCSDYYSAIFGYSRKQDSVINYLFKIREAAEPGSVPHALDWIEGFAWQKPLRPYYWKWSVVHPPGLAEDYEVIYRPDLEVFEGTLAHRKWP